MPAMIRQVPLATLGTVLLWAAGAPLEAQHRGLREVSQWGTGGAALALAFPVGRMGEVIDVAGGVDGFMAVDLGRGGPVALRIEGAFLAHQLSYDLGVLFVDVGSPFIDPNAALSFHTSSASFVTSLRAGPQITVGGEGVQLYGVLLGGISYFATTRSHVFYDCACGYYDQYYDSITLSGDVTLGWETGGGMRFRLGRSGAWLDVGARYVRHDRARYLAAGPVVDGYRSWQPVEGPADMVVLRVGVTAALR